MRYRHGTYIWTGCSAAWAGLYFIGAGEMCALVAIGCAVAAWGYNTLADWLDD